MFYILDNEKIVLCDEDKQKIENTLMFMPQYQGLEIFETDKEIIEFDGEFVFKEDVEAELEAKEKERIAEISLTRADVFEALILARGLTKQMLRSFIENDETLNDIEKALYLNRFDDALEFYRKHPAIDFIAAKLGISSDDMDKFFDTKDYMYLKPVVTPDTSTENENTDGEGVVDGDVTHDDPSVTQGEEV